MDWQGSDFSNSWRVAFQGLVRKKPAFQDAQAIAASANLFSSMVGHRRQRAWKDRRLYRGRDFTVADIVIGLSLQRRRSIPMARPDYLNVARYLRTLEQREGFVRYGLDGGP